MGLKLYQTKISPPVRAVLMLVKCLNLDVELIEVDLFKKGHMDPEYMKLNPQHTVPTLKDGDFVVWDSHAIVIYLIEKYAQNDALYPKDIQQRAIVNNRLFFDTGVLFPTLKSIFYPILFLDISYIPEERLKALDEAYDFLEKFLNKSTFIAGEIFTIADICCAATISCGNVITKISSEKFPKLYNWFKKCEAMDCYRNGNGPGLKELQNIVDRKFKSATK